MRSPVEPAKVDVEGSYEVVEGDQLELLCVTTSSNPPVSIRWWLGSRELNASAVTVREVCLCLYVLGCRWLCVFLCAFVCVCVFVCVGVCVHVSVLRCGGVCKFM